MAPQIILKVLPALMYFFLAMQVNAQQKKVSHTSQQWFRYYNQTHLAGNWSWVSDAGIRLKNQMNRFSTYLARTGLSLHLKDSTTRFTVGFTHAGFYETNQLAVLEYRPYQEGLFTRNYAPLTMKHRIRVEQRFFEGMQNKESQFNFRFRYRLALYLPLEQWTNSSFLNSLYLKAADEVFLNAGRAINHNVFDQNRLLTGAGYEASPNVSIEVMFNRQFRSRSQPSAYILDNVLWLKVRHRIP